MGAKHHFRGEIQEGNSIRFGNERHGPGSPGIGFDDINFLIFHRKLNIDKPADVQGQRYFVGVIPYFVQDGFGKLKAGNTE